MADELGRTTGALEALYRSGALSDATADALRGAGNTVEKITAGLGQLAEARELLLVTILVDDSMSVAEHLSELRLGHQSMLEALRAEQFDADVQVHTRLFNRGVLSPYTRLADALPLTEDNYSRERLVGETPLYLQALLTLWTVMVKAQAEAERGIKVRTWTLIITDGKDEYSPPETQAPQVKAVITDMLDFATNHIVAGMGVGRYHNFRTIFRGVGIPERWIFEPGASPEDLRRAFGTIAHSLALAASSEAAFAQLLLGPPSDRI